MSLHLLFQHTTTKTVHILSQFPLWKDVWALCLCITSNSSCIPRVSPCAIECPCASVIAQITRFHTLTEKHHRFKQDLYNSPIMLEWIFPAMCIARQNSALLTHSGSSTDINTRSGIQHCFLLPHEQEQSVMYNWIPCHKCDRSGPPVTISALWFWLFALNSRDLCKGKKVLYQDTMVAITVVLLCGLPGNCLQFRKAFLLI